MSEEPTVVKCKACRGIGYLWLNQGGKEFPFKKNKGGGWWQWLLWKVGKIKAVKCLKCEGSGEA